MDAIPARASIALNLGLCVICGCFMIWCWARANLDPTADQVPPMVAPQPPKPLPAVRLPAPPPASPPAQPVSKVSLRSADLPPLPAVVKDLRLDAADDGRIRLRLLEHGQGPSIEIAWPPAAVERRRLHDLFTRCYGMRSAVLDGQGDLYGADGPAGRSWPVNFDRYSGFIRKIDGRLAALEEAKAARIRLRHGVDPAAPLVRLFPRSIDAQLLGGLGRLAGARYHGARQIQAVYRLAGGKLWVDSVRVDGQPVAGSVALRGACTPGQR
jgi:hypothetical protein